MLLKTNRPPTEQERASILESMVPTNADLEAVNSKMSEKTARIEEMQLQVEQAKLELDRLREERAAILGAFSDRERVFSPFRNLPEDVLREVCIACLQENIPELSYGHTPMPYILGQICSGMRHVALTTPVIWAAISVDITQIASKGIMSYDKAYTTLAGRAIEWLDRAGVLPLTVIIQDASYLYEVFNDTDSDPTYLLFEALLSYSTRWKEFQFTSRVPALPKPLIRMMALTAADVPMLHSISLRINHSISKHCVSKQ